MALAVSVTVTDRLYNHSSSCTYSYTRRRYKINGSENDCAGSNIDTKTQTHVQAILHTAGDAGPEYDFSFGGISSLRTKIRVLAVAVAVVAEKGDVILWPQSKVPGTLSSLAPPLTSYCLALHYLSHSHARTKTQYKSSSARRGKRGGE